MLTGEVIFGGTGTGLFSMLLIVNLTAFLAGLMVGRTPEYLGKKIEVKEMKIVMLYYFATSALVMVLTGAALLIHFQPGGYWNPPGQILANLSNVGASRIY